MTLALGASRSWHGPDVTDDRAIRPYPSQAACGNVIVDPERSRAEPPRDRINRWSVQRLHQRTARWRLHQRQMAKIPPGRSLFRVSHPERQRPMRRRFIAVARQRAAPRTRTEPRPESCWGFDRRRVVPVRRAKLVAPSDDPRWRNVETRMRGGCHRDALARALRGRARPGPGAYRGAVAVVVRVT